MANLVFEDVTLHVLNKDGERWLTTRDIAAALYPYKGVPQNEAPFEKRVRNLYARHSEEFTERMTALLDIETAGGKQKIRVFSLRGAHLLGMLARTERAKHFRRWVLDIIEQHENERGLLTTEFHQALAAYATGKAKASLCGRELNQWKRDKSKVEGRVAQVLKKIQPDMFRINQFN